MSNFGFWKVGTRNGLSGAESTQVMLDDGRVQTITDKDNPAVLEDDFILFSVRNSRIAQRDLMRLLPQLDEVSQNRIETLMKRHPKAFKPIVSHQDYSDYLQSKQVKAGSPRHNFMEAPDKKR